MSKKTALDKACEELACNTPNCPYRYIDEDKYCGYEKGYLDIKKCKKCGKQYFQQHADIPDGWDVVKEILKTIRTTNKFELESYLENVICVRLRQAGIEVDDE